MNQNGYNNKADINVVLPYYTRELSESNKFRLGRRVIKANNVIYYRREISKIIVSEKTFQTERLSELMQKAIRIIK